MAQWTKDERLFGFETVLYAISFIGKLFVKDS